MARRTAIPDVRVGRFWRPDDDENTAPGSLTLAEGASPRLELDEPLTPLMRELDPHEQPEGSRVLGFADQGPELTFFTVHGALDDGTLVTLVDAFEKRRKVGKGVDRQRLQAQFALLGGHVESRDQLYVQGRLRLRHLDAWAALPGFALEDTAEAGQEGITLTFRASSPSPVAMQGGGHLDLEQTPEIEFSPLHGGRIGGAV